MTYNVFSGTLNLTQSVYPVCCWRYLFSFITYVMYIHCVSKNVPCTFDLLAIIFTYTTDYDNFWQKCYWERQKLDDALFCHFIYLVLTALPCEIGNLEDSVHCACNTVQLLQRSRLRLSWTMPSTSWTHWLQDLGSHAAASVWVVSQTIEEIKQLVEFRHCTNTAFEWQIFVFPGFTR